MDASDWLASLNDTQQTKRIKPIILSCIQSGWCGVRALLHSGACIVVRFQQAKLTGSWCVLIQVIRIDEFLLGTLCPLFKQFDQLLQTLVHHCADLAGS